MEEEHIEQWPAKGWKQILFSWHSWRGYFLFVCGAVLTGLGALYFALVEKWSTACLDLLGDSAQYWCILIVPVMLTIIIYMRDKYFQGTDGTGIPQTIAALQMDHRSRREDCLSIRIAIGKIILTTLGLFAFVSIGREGPSVQLGACFMHKISRMHTYSRHLLERGMILGGGGAGIAAAFNSPIAGIIFTMEEIGRSFDKRNMGTIVRTVLIACLVCVVGLGNYYFYGQVNADRINPIQFEKPIQWMTVIIIGPIAGLLGGMFSQCLLWTMPFVSRMISKQRILASVGIGLIIAVIGLVSNGSSLGSGYEQAQAVVLHGSPQYVSTLTAEEQNSIAYRYETVDDAYPLYRAAASFLSLTTGIPGGLFDPSFSVGAGLGKAVAPWFDWADTGQQAIVLLFMVAYFAGVVQSPMTSFIIIIEMTGTTSFAIPLGLAAILGYEVSKLVCPNALYEALAENFLRVLEGKQKKEKEKAKEGDVAGAT